MTLPPSLDVYITAALFVVGAYVAALYVGLIVWTFRDVHARSRDILGQIMAVFLVALFTLPGLVVYLLLRPHETLAEAYERGLAEEAILQDLEERRVCPGCQRRVEPDFVICPQCHEQLRLRCVGCKRLLSPQWDVCPYCGLYREQAETPTTGATEPQTRARRHLSADAPEAVQPAPSTREREGPRGASRFIRIPSLESLHSEEERVGTTGERPGRAAGAIQAIRSLWEHPSEPETPPAPDQALDRDAVDRDI